jgi:hypothetical protein
LVYLLWKRAWHNRLPIAVLIWLVACVFVSCLWFGYITVREGSWLVRDFIDYQIRLLTTPDSGHNGFLLYHWVILLIGMFPASIFFIAWFFGERKKLRDDKSSFNALAVMSFWVVLILFTLVKTKIVHYSSYCYLPMCYLGGQYLSNKEFSFKRLKTSLLVLLLVGIGLVSAAIAGLIYVARNANEFTSYINDSFAQANLLADVNWNIWLYALPLLMVVLAAHVLFVMKTSAMKQAAYLLAFNAIWIELLMLFIVPKVEAHSQGAAIQFYKSLEGKNVDVVVYGYKSYAQLYYTKKLPSNLQNDGENLLLNPVTKPLYIVTRIDRNEGLSTYPDIEFMYAKNGFEFYRKMPK